MLTSFLLLFETGLTWDKIAQVRPGFLRVFVSVGGWIALGAALESYSVHRWGRQNYAVVRHFPLGEAVIFGVAQALTWMLLVILLSKLVTSLANNFHSRATFLAAFTTIAFSLTPLFICNLLHIFPGMSPWFTWGTGLLLCLRTLHAGVPRVLDPERINTFNLFFSTMMFFIICTGMVRFLISYYLDGKARAVEAVFTEVGSRLPW